MDIREKLIAAAGAAPGADDRADAARSARTELILKALLIAAAVCFLFSFRTRSVLPYVMGSVTVLLALAYYGNRTLFSRRLRGYLTRDCDPERFLSYYSALLSSAGRQKKWESHIYNVAEGLFYLGRFDQAGELIRLYESDCKSFEGDFRHDLISTLLAHQAGNLGELKRCAALLADEGPRMRLNGELCDELDEALALPRFLEMETDGRWQELFDAVSGAAFYRSLPLGQLKKAAYLAKAAEGMGDREKALEYRGYVREHAGTTFYS